MADIETFMIAHAGVMVLRSMMHTILHPEIIERLIRMACRVLLCIVMQMRIAQIVQGLLSSQKSLTVVTGSH